MGNESHRTGRRAAGFAGAAILSAVLVSVLVRAGAPEPGSFVKPLTGEARALHALNRLGFGPRPGDVERIRAMGVEKWVEQQLHPERIAENPELAVRLEPLDTLGMSAGELVRRYPPPQVLRAVASGRLPYPSDRDERARYEALLRRLERMQAGARPAEDSDEGAGIEEPGPRPGREQRRGRAGGDPLAGILTQQERRRLRQGSPEERAKAMAALPREKQLAVIEALPPNRQMGLQFVAPPDLRRLLREYAPPQQVIQGDLVQGKLYRAILSERQLEEVLVDFWFNHFNVFAGKGADRFLVTSYEREAIRPHVLGKFENLLLATAQHPAMLFYLDNWQSVDRKAVEQLREMRSSGGARRRAGAMRSAREQLRGLPLNQLRGLNENYARELLELHTLGVDGGYTQKDVNEVARAFTGWTIGQPVRDPRFRYVDLLHDQGEKLVLGVKIAVNGGESDGRKVLALLAKHPSTARFVSTKLAQRFVADEPPKSLVDRMAGTFLQTGGDLRAVMRTMLQSGELWSEAAWRSKVKSPLELVASAIRATGAEMITPAALGREAAELGQPLYMKVEPTGYANTSGHWLNSAALLGRMNFALKLAGGRLPGVTAPVVPGESVDAVAAAIGLPQVSEPTRAAVEKGLARPSREHAGMSRSALLTGLMLGSPEFQRK